MASDSGRGDCKGRSQFLVEHWATKKGSQVVKMGCSGIRFCSELGAADFV